MVVAFSLIAETLRPKSLAGVHSAAPAVALASLSITIVAEGPSTAALAALGMIGGAVAMVICCLAGADSVRAFKATRGSLFIVGSWVATAVGIEAGLLR
jgi:hypothetical protein